MEGKSLRNLNGVMMISAQRYTTQRCLAPVDIVTSPHIVNHADVSLHPTNLANHLPEGTPTCIHKSNCNANLGARDQGENEWWCVRMGRGAVGQSR